MRCGLYGKLPAKRDFVALSAPREFLSVWEPWLQGSISASKLALGSEWQSAFLRAPIWRFWLGADLSGTTIVGAFMPSVDGVGRYFPLTVFASADSGAPIPPPEFDSQDAWFERVEGLLLSVLDERADFDAFTAAIASVEPPSLALPPIAVDGMRRIGDGTLVAPVAAGDLRGVLAAARTEDHERSYAATTFWWTAGGQGFPPLALIGTRMPHPHVFSGMLTGSFERITV